MKLVILFAMQAEAEPLLHAFQAQEVEHHQAAWLPFRCYQFHVGVQICHVVVSGKDAQHQVDFIGLEPATLMAYFAQQEFSPDLIISAGTAGGFAKAGAEIGTVYLADTFLFHDRHVPLPGFAESGLGKASTYDASGLGVALQLPLAIVSSGSSLKRSEDDIAVMRLHNVQAKEMEVAAIAWVCSLAQTPLLAVKSITNLLEHEESSEAQFERHFALAVQSLTHQLKRVLNALLVAQP